MKTLNRAFIVVFSMLIAGCVPFVQHGPWVRSGTSGGGVVAGSIVKGSFDGDGGDDAGLGIGIDFAVRGGFVPADTTKGAFAVGGTLPLWSLLFAGSGASASEILQFVAVDAYVTGPRSETHTSTFGATVSAHHVMPYFQYGSRSPTPKGWYTTQAFLMLPEEHLYMWLPSYTVVSGDTRPRATHLTFGGGIGTSNGSGFYLVSVGITMEFFRASARTR